MKYLTILSLILLLGPGTSCKKKCGCDNDPQTRITDTEVLIREDSKILNIEYKLRLHLICNEEIIPEHILDSLKKDGTSGIKMKVTGEIYPFCKEGRRMTGPFIKIETLEELK